MAQKLSTLGHFEAGRCSRLQHKLPQGNPYKFIEARDHVESIRDKTIAALQYHRSPRKGGQYENLGGFLASERISFTAKLLREALPFELGRNAVPGLEVMNNPKVFNQFHSAVLNQILPDIAYGVTLPRGELTMIELIRICETTLDLMNTSLRQLGIDR